MRYDQTNSVSFDAISGLLSLSDPKPLLSYLSEYNEDGFLRGSSSKPTVLLQGVGVSLVFAAAVHGSPEVLKCLLDYGMNPDWTRADGTSCLLAACEKGYLENAKLLLSYGANGEVRDFDGGRPLLSSASYKNMFEISEELIRLYPDKIDEEDRMGRNAFFFACGNHDIRLMERLFKAGTTMFCSNEDPLLFHCICRFNKDNPVSQEAKDAVAFLLKNGVGLTDETPEGKTAFSKALVSGVEDMELLSMLSDKSMRVDLQNGLRPLHMASRGGSVKVVSWLVSEGASWDDEDDMGWSAKKSYPDIYAQWCSLTESAALLSKHKDGYSSRKTSGI